jgi:RHS repeat-associated protein
MPCASLQRKRVEFQKSSSEIQQLLLKLGFICDNDDPVGNITQIDDNAQQTIYFNGSVVSPSQKFEYDALYRLLKSTGREHISINASSEPEAEGYNPAQISPQDGSAMRNYVREWQYDSVGNILSLIHNANGNAWTRSYDYASDSNRVNSTTVGQTTVNYTYNAHGSMTSMPHLQGMQWDFAERLCHITRGTTEAYYNYDGGGQRIRKVVEKNGVTETRLYLGGFEIWRKTVNGVLNTERETLHVMDDSTRVAVVETLTVDNSSAVANLVPVLRYQLDNHLGSASLELDDLANVISYEEYYPYGDTSYRAGRTAGEVSQKRYRYTGKEKDEESGLYYHGARYYACWLGRWTAADPIGLVDGVNIYAYVNGNPVSGVDPSGTQTEDLPECNAKTDLFLQNQEIKSLNISSFINEKKETFNKDDSNYTLNFLVTNGDFFNLSKKETYENNIRKTQTLLLSDSFAKAWIGYGKPYEHALKLIEKYSADIKQSAEKWNVNSKAIASVIFQEKFYAFWSTVKNVIAAPKLVIKDYTYSFGLTEMQVNTAALLLKERGEKGNIKQAIDWLRKDTLAIDLTAQYLAKIKKDIGNQEPYVLAQAYNLGVDNVKKGKYSYVGNRSKYFQNEIERALKNDK